MAFYELGRVTQYFVVKLFPVGNNAASRVKKIVGRKIDTRGKWDPAAITSVFSRIKSEKLVGQYVIKRENIVL